MGSRPVIEKVYDSLPAWCRDVIEGSGGMNDYERHEWVVWHVPERVAAATWAVRCLGETRCPGSAAVMRHLNRQRRRAAYRTGVRA